MTQIYAEGMSPDSPRNDTLELVTNPCTMSLQLYSPPPLTPHTRNPLRVSRIRHPLRVLRSVSRTQLSTLLQGATQAPTKISWMRPQLTLPFSPPFPTLCNTMMYIYIHHRTMIEVMQRDVHDAYPFPAPTSDPPPLFADK